MSEASEVRPYTVTGGRTRSSSVHLPIEALVETIDLRGAQPGTSAPELRRILDLADGQYLSIAELSAHLRLPIGVIRVLVGDLREAGQVRVHGLAAFESTTTASDGRGTLPADHRAAALSVLESVLDGISAL
jgi:hypothetical protein